LAAFNAELAAGGETLESAWAQYAAENARLAQARAAYADGEAGLKRAQGALSENARALADADAALFSAKADYEAALREYRGEKAKTEEALLTAENLLAEGRESLNGLDMPKWYVTTRDANSGYAGFEADSDRMEALSAIIPVFFFLVAALVCLTTMTRMVADQRIQIGALKALGFGKGQIACKYLFYAAVSSAGGAAGGVAAGLVIFPATVWDAYRILYRMPAIRLGGNGGIIAVTFIALVLCTSFPALLVCYGSLREAPAALMRPKSPSAGKRVLLERIPPIWRRLRFSNKVTARNLLLNKKRFFLTILGVTGCTALLLTGFGLRDAITGVSERQFGEIYQFGASAALYEPSGEGEDSSLNRTLAETAEVLYYQNTDIFVQSDSAAHITLQTSLFVAENIAAAPRFIAFTDSETGREMVFPAEGAILTKKLAGWLRVKTGDTIGMRTTQTDGTDLTAQITVAGIMENYVGHVVYISPGAYRAAFGRAPEYKNLQVRFTRPGQEEKNRVMAEIVGDENVTGALDIEVLNNTVSDMLGSLNAIVRLIITLAGTLAFVVLYNLTNINIIERMREIATLKVLGFYEKEVGRYIFRENRILTLMGILLGLLAGVWLAAYVVSTAEVDEVMFRRGIQPLSYAFAVIFTLASSALVNLAMRKRLRGIGMVESLKSAE
jgi:putative ABC transport system permease protein